MSNSNLFDEMSWHDNAVYNIAFTNEHLNFKLDIDYILEWVQREDNKGFKFIVAPADLCFENVSNLKITISQDDNVGVYIESIVRENRRLDVDMELYIYDFIIKLDAGEISFTSTGFIQTLKSEPKLLDTQRYR